MLTSSALLLFGHTFFCLILVWRFAQQSTRREFFITYEWKIWIIFHILFVFCFSQIPLNSLILKLIILYIPPTFLFLMKYILDFLWKEHFLVQFEFFVNSLIFQIKTGYGFRSAFQIATSNLPQTAFQKYFMEIQEFIIFSKKLSSVFQFSPLQQLLSELKRSDQSSQCLLHLENIRQYIRTRSYFQRKVRSALLQVRIQSFILFIIYSGLLILILCQYGWKYPKILFFSFCLFTSGLIFLFHCGKKIKWNI